MVVVTIVLGANGIIKEPFIPHVTERAIVASLVQLISSNLYSG